MPAIKALIYYLNELDQPVITGYQIAVFLFKAYSEKKYKGIPIKSPATSLSKEIYNHKIKQLCATGILTSHPSFGAKQVFSIIGKKGSDAGDIACAVDPFAYVSHLSAMAWHGITDRIPSTLFISSPSPSTWTKCALQKMNKDLDTAIHEYLSAGLPRLKRISIRKIGKMPVIIHTSLHLGAYKNVKDRSLRVSTIGRTFLDMVREPKLCGGMKHCIDIFNQYGRQYNNLIIDELNRHGKNIEKSRVGYLLENTCGIRNDKLDEWSRHVIRGGSRKLDPTNEYEHKYSERWNISLNVPELDGLDADM